MIVVDKEIVTVSCGRPIAEWDDDGGGGRSENGDRSAVATTLLTADVTRAFNIFETIAVPNRVGLAFEREVGVRFFPFVLGNDGPFF